MKVESVGSGQDFGIGNMLVSICSPGNIDQSCLSRLWVHAGKQSCVRSSIAHWLQSNLATLPAILKKVCGHEWISFYRD